MKVHLSLTDLIRGEDCHCLNICPVRPVQAPDCDFGYILWLKRFISLMNQIGLGYWTAPPGPVSPPAAKSTRVEASRRK